MSGHRCEVVHVESFREPWRPEDKAGREGWSVTCPTCGPLSEGWAYFRQGDALATATKHERKHAKVLSRG